MPKPDEPPPSEEAITLANRLLQRMDSREYLTEPTRAEIETADVEATVDRFTTIVRMSDRWKEPIPCLDFGEMGQAPIDFLPMAPWGLYLHPYSFHPIWLELKGAFGKKNKLFMAEPKEAQSFFRDGLVKFLSSRFRFAHTSKAATPSKGLPFTVYTKRDGYRVHYTFSHLITRVRYLARRQALSRDT